MNEELIRLALRAYVVSAVLSTRAPSTNTDWLLEYAQQAVDKLLPELNPKESWRYRGKE